ncbi:MAG: hypothetical protein WAX69_25425 [Victivallales bacterium]
MKFLRTREFRGNCTKNLKSKTRVRAMQAVLSIQEKSARMGLDKLSSTEIDSEISESRQKNQ